MAAVSPASRDGRVIPVGVETEYVIGGVDSLRYQTPVARQLQDTGELLFVKLRYKAPDGYTSRLLTHPVEDVVRDPSQDLRFASAVAGFGMSLALPMISLPLFWLSSLDIWVRCWQT